MTCTEKCWTPIICETHGNRLEPAGRSGADYVPCDCKNTVENTCHLWDEHDSTRWYTDPDGWQEHETTCPQCNPYLGDPK